VRFHAFCPLIPLVLFVAFSMSVAETVNLSPPRRQKFDDLNETLLANQQGKPVDNIAGGIAWGLSYQMDAYLDMFETTGEATYLNDFIDLADRVLSARADKTGTLDYRGRITFGWPSGGHYTLGVPVVLEDARGKPSIRLRTIARSHNDKTAIAVLAASKENKFHLLVIDNRIENEPKEILHEDLTLKSVEEQVNPSPGETGLIEVQVVGDSVPAPKEAFTSETEIMTFHGHHTGKIVIPFARFCALVLGQGKSPEHIPKAREYLSEMRATMAEHDQFYVDKGDWGYTIFEKGSPFWCDGAPEVHNTLSCSGDAYLHLYRATGEPFFLERASELATLIRDHHIENPDGTWMFYYWWGLMHEGWGEEDEVSENLPFLEGYKTPEDLSHFQLSLRFMLDCQEDGLVFTEGDLRKWAKTFRERMIGTQEDGSPYFLYRLNGEQGNLTPGLNNHVIYALMELGAKFDPELLAVCRKIYEKNYAETASPVGLRGWAALARAVQLQESNPSGE
jgi:hypothetical protein